MSHLVGRLVLFIAGPYEGRRGWIESVNGERLTVNCRGEFGRYHAYGTLNDIKFID